MEPNQIVKLSEMETEINMSTTREKAEKELCKQLLPWRRGRRRGVRKLVIIIYGCFLI